MKVYLMTALMVAGSKLVCSQPQHPKLVRTDTNVERIINVDTITYSIKNQPLSSSLGDKMRLIYANHDALDSTGLELTDLLYCDGQIVGEKRFDGIYRISPDSISRISFLKSSSFSHIVHDWSNYYSVVNGNEVFKVSFRNNQGILSMLFSLDSILCEMPPCYGNDETENIEAVYFLNGNNYLVVTCVMGDASTSCEYFNYYLCNQKTTEINRITDRIKTMTPKQCRGYERSALTFPSRDRQYFRGYTKASSSICRENIRRDWIIDSELNVLGEILLQGTGKHGQLQIAGGNVINGKISSYYVTSKLQSGEKVLVSYDFIPELEIDFYRIYNNQVILANQSTATFGREELSLLRNMIFAKHNYNFSSEFYQAYFNLFTFYNEPAKTKSRLKNVNHLLTDIDRENLRQIAEAEKRLK